VGALGQVLLGSERKPVHAPLEQRVTAQAIGVVPIGIAGSDRIDTLGQEIRQRVLNVGRMARVVEGCREAWSEANLAVNAAQQEDTKAG
jgi:hypothetical protein